MSKQNAFLIYCVELYASEKQISGQEAFRLFEEYDVIDYIYNTYEALHTVSDAIVLEDIDHLMMRDL